MLLDLDRQNLVVSLKRSIKGDLDIKVNPNLVAILQIDSNFTLGNKQIDLEADTVLEISKDVTNIDSNNADANSNLKGVGVDISCDL